MPRGRKKTHKGGHRHFTSEDDLARQQEKARKEREWREKKGIASDEDEDGEDEKKPSGSSTAAGATAAGLGSSDEDSDADDEDDADSKPKGVAHLIDIENPNHLVQKTKKVSELDGTQSQPNLSRREREELEKQQAKEHYEKMHLAGKTDEARSDLARLALIKKQREDAAKKRDEERKAQEETKAAAEKRLLDKKAKSAGDAKS